MREIEHCEILNMAIFVDDLPVKIHLMLFVGLKNHHLTGGYVPLGEFLVDTSCGLSTLEGNEHN